MTDNNTKRFITQTIQVEAEVKDPLFCEQDPITLESLVDGGKTLSIEVIDRSGNNPAVVPLFIATEQLQRLVNGLPPNLQSGFVRSEVQYTQAQVAAMEARKKALPPAPEEEPTVLDVDAVDEGYTDPRPSKPQPKVTKLPREEPKGSALHEARYEGYKAKRGSVPSHEVIRICQMVLDFPRYRKQGMTLSSFLEYFLPEHFKRSKKMIQGIVMCTSHSQITLGYKQHFKNVCQEALKAGNAGSRTMPDWFRNLYMD